MVYCVVIFDAGTYLLQCLERVATVGRQKGHPSCKNWVLVCRRWWHLTEAFHVTTSLAGHKNPRRFHILVAVYSRCPGNWPIIKTIVVCCCCWRCAYPLQCLWETTSATEEEFIMSVINMNCRHNRSHNGFVHWCTGVESVAAKQPRTTGINCSAAYGNGRFFVDQQKRLNARITFVSNLFRQAPS